ncbi:hypothetical protein CAL22_00735 [Bordetella genomosp. 12]|uniref:Uncharacterized protein n=1 Tax=Bordetella genomosp. 12 TaxID=463035 RepID=A0A261VSN0_9BORD|nr:hypothetical protein CAL22_00735 [Bordetella genomosp. 12]
MLLIVLEIGLWLRSIDSASTVALAKIGISLPRVFPAGFEARLWRGLFVSSAAARNGVCATRMASVARTAACAA